MAAPQLLERGPQFVGEIFGALGLSPRSVETYRERIMTKTGARNYVGLILYAVRKAIIRP
ncbi:MAG: hypothetical protein EOO11_20805 [Chitinophagaceae bacterium]|nr:MAG: hypothetical protein EOO11_20805 [Chitinophagaceae bacterium]